MTDWSATGQMLSGIGTISGSIAIVVVAFLGRNAVKDFRQQKVVERQIEQAETALTILYKLKDAISDMRSPATWGHESESSRDELVKLDWFNALPKDQQERFVQANVFCLRMRRHEDVFDSAFSILPFVKAFFGSPAEDSFRTILRNGRSVKVYADAYARDTGHDAAFTRKIEGIIWEGGVDPLDDHTSIEINEAVAAVEATLLPIVRLNT